MCPSLLPMPAWPAAVLIRSLSTLRCDPSQSWRSGSSQAGTDRTTHTEVPPLMLAELVHHVVGVDPDRDWITLAVLDAPSAGVVAEGRFAATGDGYDDAVDFVDTHSSETERAWVIEGSGGYGRGLSAALARRVGDRVRSPDPQEQRRRQVRRARRHPCRLRDARPSAPERPSSSSRDP